MNSSIFLKDLLERKRSTFIIALSLALFGIMYASLFKSMSVQVQSYIQAVPSGLEAVIGDLSAAATPHGWLNIELYSLFMPLAMSIAAIAFGAGVVGREEESGTLELLLASPISRTKILREKSLAVAGQAGIIAITTWLGVALGSIIFEFNISLINVLWASLAVWLLAIVYGLSALAAQSIRGSRVFGFGAGAGFLAVTYAAHLLSNLVSSLHFLRYFSPFYYYKSPELLASGKQSGIVVLAGLVIILYVIAQIGFNSRDTGV